MIAMIAELVFLSGRSDHSDHIVAIIWKPGLRPTQLCSLFSELNQRFFHFALDSLNIQNGRWPQTPKTL